MKQGVYTIRPALPSDAQAIASIHVESWRTTYKDVLPEAFLAGLSVEKRKRFWTETLSAPEARTVTLLALIDNQSIGFVSGGPERTGNLGCDGELYAIYLRQSAQRQGIGSRLVQALIAEFETLGFKSMAVWVLARNPSRYFYESLGGKLIAEQTIERGGLPFSEVAYAWSYLACFKHR